jgi:hypothetical protein
VIASITAVAVLFVSLFAVLWYRSWWKVPGTPSAQFIVEGGPEHDGMVVTVEGSQLAGPLQATLRKEEKYVALFALPAGSYAVRITHDGRLYLQDPMFHLPEYHRMHVPLKKIDEERRKAASRPA